MTVFGAVTYVAIIGASPWLPDGAEHEAMPLGAPVTAPATTSVLVAASGYLSGGSVFLHHLPNPMADETIETGPVAPSMVQGDDIA